jgi:uncharacterized membrane protein YkoI
MRLRVFPAAILFILIVGPARVVLAGEDPDHVRYLKEAGDILPLDTLIQRVSREQHPGRLIEAELEKRDGRYLYELEFVDEQGVVSEFFYDARTGELVKSEGQGAATDR